MLVLCSPPFSALGFFRGIPASSHLMEEEKLRSQNWNDDDVEDSSRRKIRSEASLDLGLEFSHPEWFVLSEVWGQLWRVQLLIVLRDYLRHYQLWREGGVSFGLVQCYMWCSAGLGKCYKV